MFIRNKSKEAVKVKMMSSYTRPPTLSQALLSLGRIRSIENSIAYGLSAFYRARECVMTRQETDEEVKLDLKRFEEFCSHFTKIVSSESENPKLLEKWLLEKPADESNSRVDTFLIVHSLFLEEAERERWSVEFKTLEQIARETREEPCDARRANEALAKLKQLRLEIRDKLQAEKRSSEKVLSGRAPFI